MNYVEDQEIRFGGNIAFGIFLRKTRFAHQMSQEDLAQAVDTDTLTISRLERGAIGKIKLSTLGAIQEILSVDKSLFQSMFMYQHKAILPANIFPVIHVKLRDEALKNVTIAQDSGANGVFLISHGELKWDRLLDLAHECKSLYPTMQIGVNFLDLPAWDAIKTANDNDVDMIWTDALPNVSECQEIKSLRDNMALNVRWYGGVAFKYQPMPMDLQLEAEGVRDLVDVLTTSGVGTGIAPEIEKLQHLARGFEKKIAVASGVTPENAVSMLPYVSDFLVATGIGKDFHNLDPKKCKALCDNIRNAEWK